MPFRWFKQHEKTLMYFVAFFIMPTFLIGIGAYAFFGNLGQAQTVAKFELVPGKTEKVSRDEVQDMARRFNNNNIPALAATKARIEEAKLAGIYVSKDELKARIELILQNAFPGGYTANQYKGLVAQQGLSISQFERSMRDQLMVERLASLKRTERRSTSSEVFNAWARDNTRVTLDYISFSAEDIANEMDVFEIKPEEVTEFYERAKENPAEYAWALERYTTPQKWDLEALFVQFEGFDPAAHEDFVGDVEEPTEDEMRAYYERRIAWFTPEAEDGADDPEPTPFEDVQEEIKTRLVVERGMERVYDALLEEQINNDAVDLEDFAGNQGVFYHLLTGKEASELEADDVIGYDGLPIDLSQLQAGDLSRGVVTEREDGVFVLRVNRIKEPDFKPEQAVDVLLREDIIVERSREQARMRARDFHKEADQWIEDKIKKERGQEDDPADSDEDGEDADDAPETPADQVAQAELDEEKRNRMGEAFDALVEDKGLEVTRIGPKKLIQLGAPEAEEIEDPSVKYLLTAGMVKTLDEGDVQGNSLFDRENHVGYVVRMVEKGEPDPSEMPEADYRDYLQQRLFSQIQTASQFQQFRDQQWLQQIKLSGPGIPTTGGGGIPGAPR